MHRLLTILAIVFYIPAFAQGGDTVFKVKKQSGAVSVYPVVDVLYKNVSKKLKLINPGLKRIDSIIFTEGTILRKDSFFAIKPTKTGTGILKIYTRNANGKSELAYVQEFAVRTFAEPKPNVDGVGNDSAIHRMKVVAQGYVNVPKTADKDLKRISHPVLSFQMQTTEKGKMDTLKASGNRMTYEMRDRIDHLPDGSSILLSNIKYLLDGDTFIIREPLRIFLFNDKVNKF